MRRGLQDNGKVTSGALAMMSVNRGDGSNGICDVGER